MSANSGGRDRTMHRRTTRLLLICVLAAGTVACTSSDRSHDSPREQYCYSARLDFERVIRKAGQPARKSRSRASARSILALFASNGEAWLKGSPRRLARDSEAILEAARDAARGRSVALDDAVLVTAFQNVREYAARCQ
jgi:hypothetical protein